MVCHGSVSLKSAFIFMAAATTGCGAVFVQPLTHGKSQVPNSTKNTNTSNSSLSLAKRPGSKQTLSQIMKHEDDRMSGKVLWRNSKNHAAGSNCLCSFTQDQKKCARDNDDDSHCFLVCCIAGKTSDCTCGWAIATNQACLPSQNDGSECFASCCNDVATDLQTYGPLAYPGAELLYPPGVPVPRNPFWAPEQPGEQPTAQQLYPVAQPAAQPVQQPAAQPLQQLVPQPGAYPGANMSQGYPAAAPVAQSYPAEGPEAGVYPGGYALNSMNASSNRSTSKSNASEVAAINAQPVQRSHKKSRQYSRNHKHHKGKRS